MRKRLFKIGGEKKGKKGGREKANICTRKKQTCKLSSKCFLEEKKKERGERRGGGRGKARISIKFIGKRGKKKKRGFY